MSDPETRSNSEPVTTDVHGKSEGEEESSDEKESKELNEWRSQLKLCRKHENETSEEF